MTIDRYKAHIVTDGKNVLVAHSDVCLYTDHEQAMVEKDARIIRLEFAMSLNSSGRFLNIFNESPQVSLANIKADAIEEMVRKLERDHDSQAEFNLWYDVRYYANKLRSNK